MGTAVPIQLKFIILANLSLTFTQKGHDYMSKEKFDQKLIKLLESNPDFVDDAGELLRAKVTDRAWKLDHDLIKLLLKDKEVETKFFKEIEGRWIFDNNTFITYITDKNFFADSYTKFRNKIGLNIDGKYLRERGEVTLVWPYKDCVLEGGQTKEEEKRKEIFFNEILAQDEINRMFDPKVLTNWKRHTAAGEQKVTDIERDDNGTIRESLIITGNNLIALHCLKEKLLGDVKLIYADPPYNTGGGNIFSYNNTFNHSTWLTFMKNRLEVARDLLKAEGMIVIAIDDAEMYYLGVLLDEVFGRENKIGVVCIRHHPRGRTQSSFFSAVHEYALFYAKDITKIKEDFRFDSDDVEEEESFIRGREDATPETRPTQYYPIFYNPTTKEITLDEKGEGFVKILPENRNGKRTWQLVRESFLQELKDKKIVVRKVNGKYAVYRKLVRKKNKAQTMWIDPRYDANHHGTVLLKKMFDGQTPFNYPKSLHTLLDIFKLTTDKSDIILDFFAGSGTTGHAVLELNKQDGGNRKFILVEQLDEHIAVCKERIEKVIAQEGLPGGDFVSCELMPYNQVFMERIQSAESSEELLGIWRDMSKDSMLNWYVKPQAPTEAEEHFIAIKDVEKQRQLLAELLDKNQLYVHLSEMEDETFKVSETDKVLNWAFYGESL